MTPQQKALYKKIDEILWEDWDPIGVNDVEYVRNEYQGYTPQLFSLKTQGANKTEIAEYLYKLETVEIGVTGNIEHCEKVAQKIIDLKPA